MREPSVPDPPPPAGQPTPDPQMIARAAERIDPVFLDSPQYRAVDLEAGVGCRLTVKVETLNPIRSFKGRGACLLVAGLEGRPRLACATAGNFGQGMAWAARGRGLALTVFAAASTSPIKLDRMRALGAEVRLEADLDAAHLAARAFAAASGARLVEDGREPAIAEGAGTIGVELSRRGDRFDAVVAPVGDGALMGGLAAWFRSVDPATRMIGVCARGAPAMERSWRAGEVRDVPAATIADGIAVRRPYPEALAALAGRVDEFLLVDDRRLVEAMRLAHLHLGTVLEPSGAAALAALIEHRERFAGIAACAVLTGGNLTSEQMREWLGH